MNVRKNARLTPVGRALLARRVEGGWTARSAAEAAGVSVRTAHEWLARHRPGGERGHRDRGSAPGRTRAGWRRGAWLGPRRSGASG